MKKWDVVVIGAGPAGSFAAKVAAENGCQVLLLEEHHAVGQPRHGTGWLLGTDFTEELIKPLKGKIPVQKVYAFNIYDADSGKAVVEAEDTGWGGYLVNRQLFDREIALMALEAGAKISLATKVVDLIREGDQIVGAKTNSKRLPEIRAGVVICADGIRSLHSGFAQRELLKGKEEEYSAGILMELVGVKDIKPGIIEGYQSADKTISGRNLWTHSSNSCLITFSHINIFWDLKQREDNLLSRKIKDAQPLQINGYYMREEMGRFCEGVVDKGVIFVGDASGNSGIIHGMISAYYGAMATAEAVKEKDMGSLMEYERMLKASDIYRYPYCWRTIKKEYGSFAETMESMKGIQV